MSTNNDDDEGVICRMCHSEGEPDRPLFYPCKCSGSIRYVHQDCLIQWLKVKSRSLSESKCELCGELYKFRNVYRTGHAPSLGILEFLLALIPMAKSMISNMFHSAIFFVLWVVGLPLMTSIIHDFLSDLLIQTAATSTTNVIPFQTIESALTHAFMEPTLILSSWWQGVFKISFIAFLSLASFQVIYFLYYEYRRMRIQLFEMRIVEIHQRIETLRLHDAAINNGGVGGVNSNVNVAHVNNDVNVNVPPTQPATPTIAPVMPTNTGALVVGHDTGALNDDDDNDDDDVFQTLEAATAAADANSESTTNTLQSILTTTNTAQLINNNILNNSIEDVTTIRQQLESIRMARAQAVADADNLRQEVEDLRRETQDALLRFLGDNNIHNGNNNEGREQGGVEMRDNFGRQEGMGGIEIVEDREGHLEVLLELNATDHQSLLDAAQRPLDALDAILRDVRAEDAITQSRLLQKQQLQQQNLQPQDRNQPNVVRNDVAQVITEVIDEIYDEYDDLQSIVVSEGNYPEESYDDDEYDDEDEEDNDERDDGNDNTVWRDSDKEHINNNAATISSNIEDSVFRDVSSSSSSSLQPDILLNQESYVISTLASQSQQNFEANCEDIIDLASTLTPTLIFQQNTTAAADVNTVVGARLSMAAAQDAPQLLHVPPQVVAQLRISATIPAPAVLEQPQPAAAALEPPQPVIAPPLQQRPIVPVAAGGAGQGQDNIDQLGDLLRDRNTRFEFTFENWLFTILFVTLFLFITDVITTLCGRLLLYAFGWHKIVLEVIEMLLLLSASVIVNDSIGSGIISPTNSATTSSIEEGSAWINPINNSSILNLYEKLNISLPQTPYSGSLLSLLWHTTQHSILSPSQLQSLSSLSSSSAAATSYELFNDRYVLLSSVEAVVGGVFFFIILLVFFFVLLCRHVKNIPRLIKFSANQIYSLTKHSMICMKASVLFSFEMVFTPLLIGVLFLLVTLKTIQSTLTDRIEIFLAFPFICLLGLWVVGICIIFHFGLILTALRHLLKENIAVELLPGFRDIDGFIEVLLTLYENQTLGGHVRRILMNFSFFLALFVLAIFIPIRLGHILFPFQTVQPLVIHFSKSVSDAEKSVELLVSHLLLPILVERTQTDLIERLFRFLFHVGGKALKLGCYLNSDVFIFARQPQPHFVPIPPVVIIAPVVVPAVLHQPPLPVVPQAAVVAMGTTETPANNPNTNVNDATTNQIAESATENNHYIDNTATTTPQLIHVHDPQSQSLHLPLPLPNSPLFSYLSNAENYPLEFRTILFIVFLAVSISLVYSSAIHIPLNIGRYAVFAISGNTEHDIFAMCIGVVVCWLVSQTISYISRDITNNNRALHSFLTLFSKWAWVGIKLVVLGSIALTIPPLLIGILNEAMFLNPITVSLMETPTYPFFRCWALGLIFSKGWVKFTMMGIFGETEWRRKWQRVYDQGLVNVDAVFVLRDVLSPLILLCLDYLLTPFFVSRTICFFFVNDYTTQTIITRFAFITYLLLIQLLSLGEIALKNVVYLHNHIRDSRYLIGTELTNRF